MIENENWKAVNGSHLIGEQEVSHAKISMLPTIWNWPRLCGSVAASIFVTSAAPHQRSTAHGGGGDEQMGTSLSATTQPLPSSWPRCRPTGPTTGTPRRDLGMRRLGSAGPPCSHRHVRAVRPGEAKRSKAPNASSITVRGSERRWPGGNHSNLRSLQGGPGARPAGAKEAKRPRGAATPNDTPAFYPGRAPLEPLDQPIQDPQPFSAC